MTGGYDGHIDNSLSSSELLSSDGLCKHNIPQLPVTLFGASSVYLKDHVLVCGGQSDSDCQDSCYKLNSSSSSWTQAAPLNRKRSSFTLTKVINDYLTSDLIQIMYSLCSRLDKNFMLLVELKEISLIS